MASMKLNFDFDNLLRFYLDKIVIFELSFVLDFFHF